MQRKVTDLSNEMMDLKKCQIDLLKIAIAVFTAVSSILLAFYKHCSPITVFTKHGDVYYNEMVAILALASIIPLLFPYLSWIIIYKSRSLFRISSYIRLLEHFKLIPDPDANINIYDFNYEKLYREMRNDPWLLARFTDSPIRNYLNRWRPYFSWKNKYLSVYGCGVDNAYKGGFYSRILRFITYMSMIYVVITLCFATSFVLKISASPKYSGLSIAVFPFYIYILLSIAYYAYNGILLFRYNKELLYIPFSQDAQYGMWLRAYKRIAEPRTVENRKYHRVKPNWHVTLKSANAHIEGHIANISPDGALILCTESLPSEEESDIIVNLPNQKVMNMNGRTVWKKVRGPKGKDLYSAMGVRFTQISKEGRQFLCKMIGEL